MKFLLRAAFWLGIVVILLPTDASQRDAQTPQLSTIEAVAAASAAVSDMRQFCTRQPDACVVGSQALARFEQKAQAGAKMLYEFLTAKFGGEQNRSVASATSDKPNATSTARSSQDTLTPADLLPGWRGTLPRKEPS